MSNTKSKLVFDFPDPSPRFDFDDSPQKRAGNKLKSGRFKLRSSVGRASPKKAGGNNNSPSPDKTNSTATTASASSFDESAFDDFDDEVFDFGMKRNGGAQPAAGGGRGASPSAKSAAQHSDLSTPSSKPSFEFADSTPHKPLKLPNNHQQHGMHQRTHSGYISEVSEFSFDRVTVNTVQTGLTGVSSNVSWNFFEEAKDLGMLNHAAGMDKHGLGFVPYTGNTYNHDGDIGGANNGSSTHVKKSLNIRSLLSDDAPNTNASNTASQNNHPFNNNNNNDSRDRQIKINMDQISLSDQSNELPISGIVSSSNQSIISEISDVNMMDNEEEKLDEVVKMLNEKENDDYRKTPPPPTAAASSSSQMKIDTTPTSLNCSEDPTSKQHQSSSPSIFKQIEQYKIQRLQSRQQQREGGDGNNSRSSKINNNKNGSSNANNTENNSNNSMFETVMSNVWIGLGFCTWYLCGTDTTQCQGKNNNDNTMSKEERQKEMDDRFLGKLIFCNCHDLGCGMSNVL